MRCEDGSMLSGDLLVDSVVVFLFGLVTALATGLGALPFVFLRHADRRAVARAEAAAAGLMVVASWGLIQEGLQLDQQATFWGAVIGGLGLALARAAIGDRELHFGQMTGRGARQALLLLAVMTAHSFSEGVAVGVAFGGGERLATFITLAIALHNVPEGLAISAVLRARGESVARCAFWSVFSSLPQPLMSVPAFLFVEAFRVALPWGLGFAGGAMLWMVAAEIVPDARRSLALPELLGWGAVAAAGMAAFQVFLGV